MRDMTLEEGLQLDWHVVWPSEAGRPLDDASGWLGLWGVDSIAAARRRNAAHVPGFVRPFGILAK